jgi:hypothetical protein
LNKLKIEFKESFPTRIVEQIETPQSVEEQALYHLFQENEKAFNRYRQVLEKKNEFNEKMDKFTDSIKKI